VPLKRTAQIGGLQFWILSRMQQRLRKSASESYCNADYMSCRKAEIFNQT